MGGVRPTCLALVLCDRIGRVRQSDRASPVGVLHTISARSFPTITRPFSAWMQLTQGNGHVAMGLVIERLLPERPDVQRLFVAPFSLHFADPNVMLEHHIRYMPVLEGNTLVGVLSFHDVARAVLEEQAFENRMLKGYIKDSPT